MFTSNPWGTYLTILTPLLAVYYLFVGLRFYGRDLKALINQKRGSGNGPVNPPGQNFDVPDPPIDAFSAAALPLQTNLIETDNFADHELSQPFNWQGNEPADQVHELANHLKEAIKEAYEKDYGKQELILLLHMTLKEYPHISPVRSRTTIRNLIATECSKYGLAHLNEQDLVAVWSQQD